MVKKYIWIVCCLMASFCRAQETRFNFYSYATENGLPTNMCQFVYRDSYGFLWLASFDGLIRWDGYTFKKYEHNDADSNSIDNNIAYTVFEDSHKRLWIGTISGLNLYDRDRDRFIRVRIHDKSPTVPVNAMLEDQQHRLWLGTSYGLCRYDYDRGQSAWFTTGEDVVFCMTLDKAGNIWTGIFNKGIRKFSPTSEKFESFKQDQAKPQSLPTNKIVCILAASDNRIWAGTEDKGIVVLNNQGEVVQRYSTTSKEEPVQNTISCLYEDSSHTIWIGIQRSLLHYIKKGDAAPRMLANQAANNTREKLASVCTITADAFGNTWFGSRGSGLFYTNRYKNIFTAYLQQPDLLTGLQTRAVNCFYEDAHGKIWIGTNGSGLLHFDPASGQLTQPANAALRTDAINDIQADADGTIWIATWAAGVKAYQPATGRVSNYRYDAADTASLIYNNVKAVLPDDSVVWIGTHGEGLAAFHKRTGRFIHYRNNRLFPFDMQAPAWINHLYKDRQKRLWISTYSGVFVFDGRRLQKFDHQADTGSISSNAVNMVTQDAQGTIWIVSEQGLDRYDEQNNRFMRYTAKYHLPAAMKSIVTGPQQTLWISTNDGVVVFDPASGKVKKYDAADGLAESTYQKTILITRGGQCYTGGSRGFDVFEPGRLQIPQLPAHFYFTDLRIYNDEQRPGASSSPLQKVLAFTDTLTLSHTQSFFTIGFTAINLYATSKTKYQYRLLGLNDQWLNVAGDRHVSFTDLQPGAYILQIRYTGADGQWAPAPRELHVVIMPPWWKTWWFTLLVVVLAITGLILLFYLRVAAVRKRNVLLKQEVARQTQELQLVNADLVEQRDEIKMQKERLEESNEEVLRQTDKILDQQQHIMGQNQVLAQTVSELEKLNQTKDHFFAILAHDLKNPVSALNDITGFLKQQLQRMERRELEHYLDSMHNASAAVYELLINLLNWSTTQSKKIRYVPASLQVAELVAKNIRLLEPQFRNKNITVQVHTPASLFVWADYHMIDTVIRNLLNNSIKFTGYNGRVVIDALQNDSSVELCIADNGLGMTVDQQKRLFSIDKTIVLAGTAGEKGTGLGLVITKEFMAINQGTIDVTSEPGKGSSFRITLPAAAAEEPVAMQATTGETQSPDFWEAFPTDKLLKIKGKKILIVDDNREMRDYLKLVLSDTFEIFEAGGGQEGWKTAQETLPAIIITDLLMPDMNGLDFCRLVKEHTATSHIPVVMVTSQWEHQMQASGYEAGADVYLTKPLKKELLIQVILNQLQKQEKLHRHILENMQHEGPFHTADIPLSKTDEEFLQQLVRSIETYMADPNLDARLLSKEMAVSRTILYAKVKTLTGQTVHEFIKSIRLKQSLKLLLEGKMSISQVAFAVGFNSHSYFDKCFVKQYKTGPKEYISKRLKK